MYSGITQGLFPITSLQRQDDLVQYTVALNESLLIGLAVGASVSIDGVCQSVVAIDDHNVLFQAMAETLARTTVANFTVGQQVSVERSLKYGEEIGGHEVAGHINGTAEIIARDATANNLCLTLQVPCEWMKYIQTKGYIAVDGSSLTVGATDASGWFKVHLIPETLRVTNFAQRKIGDCVNIELDHRTVTIVDTVERVLAEKALT